MAAITQPTSNIAARAVLAQAQFREIHKNTWLKRLNADGKKITVGPKKSERSWVVFCVHDDTEAILEGYAEPRQAASHNPEWAVLLQNTLHISHALIPNSNEFEFVVTLSNEVIRFHAMSWEIMQEWVDTLRSKLREMKIISPRENLYTKLPEIRPPLLPTRDPTSPLPLPPPVPAAIVPGVEILVPQSAQQQVATSSSTQQQRCENVPPRQTAEIATTTSTTTSTTTATTGTLTTTQTANIVPAMSNTLTQNLLNMLSDPISSYSEQVAAAASNARLNNSEQLSTSLNDLRLHQSSINEDEDCLSPLLRPGAAAGCSAAANSKKRNSADQPKNVDRNNLQSDRLIPRPQTSRSQSAGAADKSKNIKTQNATQTKSSNRTALEITGTPSSVGTTAAIYNAGANGIDENSLSNITIIEVSSTSDKNVALPSNNDDALVPTFPAKSLTSPAADIFKFPEITSPPPLLPHDDVTVNALTTTPKHGDYKTNVQLIPSNGSAKSSTIKILGDTSFSSPSMSLTSTSFSAVANQYSTPIKKKRPLPTQQQNQTIENNQAITTVHVGGCDTSTSPATATTTTSIYGTCFTLSSTTTTGQVTGPTTTPAKLPKKIILSANTSGITNITVDSDVNSCHQKNENVAQSSACSSSSSVRCNAGSIHYEKVFLSSSTPIVPEIKNAATSAVTATTTSLTSTTAATTIKTAGPNISTQNSPSISANTKIDTEQILLATPAGSKSQQEQQQQPATRLISKAVQTTTTTASSTSSTTTTATSTSSAKNSTTEMSASKNVNITRSPLVQRRAVAALRSANMLTRGLTEAVITARPRSRRDIFASGSNNATTKNQQKPTHSAAATKSSAVNNNENGESLNSSVSLLEQQQQQRRRSSSTSDATTVAPQRPQRGSVNNNELLPNHNHIRPNNIFPLRFQQPPQTFRNVGSCENALAAVSRSPPLTAAASPSKRLTLREQQVMQLRREIMHPGGVRLQLRRKDCIGSIAWVEAFGAVWVAGWKQKEHPVLYNALHIGDQLLSIAGIVIGSVAEANKVIRNTNTLFVELLIRRIPFGCGIAIRRDREGQCLGLIRDGNTATIVDVVPNSLSARHGLPPKAQACDGSTLTFWVLTEINGRPLNLFFKDNEIRDRLNSVGRDISILVQPSDLITKLKKQLKSLRGYKDYLVQ